MLDHRLYAAREILCELAGCWAGGLRRIRAHWCAWVAGVVASGTVGHFDPSELEVSVACGDRLPPRKTPASDGGTKNSENSKANRIETMKGPAESGQICSVGRRKIAKKIAKNKRCYANSCDPAQGC